jgi:hypothetical protein
MGWLLGDVNCATAVGYMFLIILIVFSCVLKIYLFLKILN